MRIHPISIPQKLQNIKNPPKTLYALGDTSLLESPLTIAIIGTRRPNLYAKNITAQLASELSKAGATIISGGALGIDIIAHANSLPSTIMVSPSSLDIFYPASNKPIIEQIAKQGLLLSEYEKCYPPERYAFILRNRLIIALSDLVIIPQADLKSGSMQSARIAQEQGKPLYVLSHKITESLGTNYLLQNNLAKGIFSLQGFIESLGLGVQKRDEILEFCALNPSFEEAFLRFGDKLLEYEIEGKILRSDGRVRVARC